MRITQIQGLEISWMRRGILKMTSWVIYGIVAPQNELENTGREIQSET